MKCPEIIGLDKNFHPNTSKEREKALHLLGGSANTANYLAVFSTSQISKRAMEYLATHEHSTEEVQEFCQRMLEGMEENEQFIRSCT